MNHVNKNTIATPKNAPSLNPVPRSFRDIFGPILTTEEVEAQLIASGKAYEQYLKLSPSRKLEIRNFISGTNSLYITYDTFFNKIFSPYEHPDRLEEFISCLLDMKINILEVLPREGSLINDKGHFVIMDIIVKAIDGSIINIEMQKVGYKFPGERADCYISDAIMRQYVMAKNRLGDTFSYKIMKPAYLIILLEDSPKELKAVSPVFIHQKVISYDSGAKLNTLENIRYISLDTFRSAMQNKTELSKLEAWLTFFSATNENAINNLIRLYPSFIDIYQEISDFRKDLKEVIGMYSEALAIMDHNTELLMIDELQQAVAAKDAALAEKDSALAEKDSALAEKDSALAEKDSALAEKDSIIAELLHELGR